MTTSHGPSCPHLAAWKTGSKESGGAYGTVARSMLALWKRDQDKATPAEAHGTVCMTCAALSSSPSRHTGHSSQKGPGHDIALDLERVELYCSACRDYVYDGDFDRAMMGAATLAAEGRNGGLQSSGPVPRVLESLNESAQSDLRRRSSGDDAAALQDPAAIEKLAHVAGGSDGMPAGLRGLVNLGNTCFMNSVLQALLHAPVLRSFYLGGGHPNPLCPRNNSRPCLSCELDSIFSAAYSGQRSPFSPTSFLYSWWRHADSLAGYQQQDAHEFYIYALSGLSSSKVAATPTPSVTPPPPEVKPEVKPETYHTWQSAQQQHLPDSFRGLQAGEPEPNQGVSLNGSSAQWPGESLLRSVLPDRAPSPQPRASRPPAESGSSGPPGEDDEEGIVNRAFGGLLRSDVTCDACGYTSTVYEPFLDISLDIERPTALPPPLLRPPPATVVPHHPKQRKLSGAAALAAAKAAARTSSASTASAPAALLPPQQPAPSAGPLFEVASTPDLMHTATPASTETSDAALANEQLTSSALGEAEEGSRAPSREPSENLTEGGRSNVPEASAPGASSTDGNSSVGAGSAIAVLMDRGGDETLTSPLHPPASYPQGIGQDPGGSQPAPPQQPAIQAVAGLPFSRPSPTGAQPSSRPLPAAGTSSSPFPAPLPAAVPPFPDPAPPVASTSSPPFPRTTAATAPHAAGPAACAPAQYPALGASVLGYPVPGSTIPNPGPFPRAQGVHASAPGQYPAAGWPMPGYSVSGGAPSMSAQYLAPQAAPGPQQQAAKRPKVTRCGECYNCRNKHLKKGCLRNLELRKKATEAQKQGLDPEAMVWQPGEPPAQPHGNGPGGAPLSAWQPAPPPAAKSLPKRGYTASLQPGGVANGYALPGRPPIYGNTAKLSQVKAAKLEGGSAPGPSLAYQEPAAKQATPRSQADTGGGMATLLGCLRRYVRSEALGKWACDRCQRKQAVKQVSIRRLPAVLCLHLKRFQHPGIQGVGRKLTTPLAFPAVLDMRPYLSSSVLRSRYAMRNGARHEAAAADGAEGEHGAAGGSSVYELYAVVCHKGNLQGGHYICYIKCGESWFECDDSWVMAVDEATARSSQAYMLYYRQKTT